ncbi:hypothetical protein [Nocardiopsis sp. LOL_012]|uniref:hypothetical protein n=1 Tax=Nocardiopsis sp. LOL_012 TaxID=3345409 RepID=UPI003A84B848
MDFAATPAEIKTAPKAKTERPCHCARFENAETGETTGCTKTTTREFAPGHDAKAKSLLIRAGAMGAEVRRVVDGMALTGDAVKAAEGYGFAHMVASGIERAARLAAEKAERKAARAAKKADNEPLPELVGPAAAVADFQEKNPMVTAKVGRWEYEGRVIDGEFVYETKSGERRSKRFQLV